MQPGAPGRLPRGDGRGRRRRSTRSSSATAGSTSRKGSSEARVLLRLPDPPTAIFTGNDLQALGVYQAARELRLHIPEDLSVVGFDDLPVARWVGPPLTTIRQPLVEMAETAAELVLAIARGERPPDPGGAIDRAHRPGEHGAAEPLTRSHSQLARPIAAGTGGTPRRGAWVRC